LPEFVEKDPKPPLLDEFDATAFAVAAATRLKSKLTGVRPTTVLLLLFDDVVSLRSNDHFPN
jgi:hypothetical protein